MLYRVSVCFDLHYVLRRGPSHCNSHHSESQTPFRTELALFSGLFAVLCYCLLEDEGSMLKGTFKQRNMPVSMLQQFGNSLHKLPSTFQ